MRKSRRAIRSSKAALRFDPGLPACIALLAILSVAAVRFFYARGWLLYYGDAEAHLNIARRLFDSQTPGYDQLGTYWLPLLHVLMLPFVHNDAWWHSGIAASFAPACCFILGGGFLFAAARRLFDSLPAAAVAAACAALNPNLLYLQSTAMTEAVFFGALMALLYFGVRFQDTQGWPSAIGAGIATCAATLTRYEGWLLIPFAAAWFLYAAHGRRRILIALLYCAVAAAGPLYWSAHGWYETGDFFDWYNSPYSARAIQGDAPCPGRGDWHAAWYYYRNAVQLCAGGVLPLLALAGLVVVAFRSLARRALIFPLILLAVPGAFIIWSMHSGVVPIFMPHLWPHSYYNTRYGLAALPLLALAASTLVTILPPRMQPGAALLLAGAAIIPWLAHPSPESWITWAESRANSSGRRAWMNEAAEYLAPRYRLGSGIITTQGDDLAGIYREMGIPLRETFSINNGLLWQATVERPDLFLWQEWAVVKGGDLVQTAVNRAGRYGIRYKLEKVIIEDYEPVIEIYRRIGVTYGHS
ncbi:MAG TPA: glycosyltransferase family 39 protein [Bryobacteraceae bacterium]|nr:glycosyltransferase family 39 protein [Bryobacteraceae bacterium]